jgi:hypothetical protein
MPKVAKPKLDESVEAFYKQLLEKGGLKDEEIDLLHTLLSNEKVATEFKSGVHARNLTDRAVDKAKLDIQQTKDRLETEYTKKLQEVDTLRQAIAATPSTDTGKLKTLEVALADREAKLKKVVDTAKEYERGDEFLSSVGLNGYTPLNLTTVNTDTRNTQPTQNQPSVSKEDLLKEIMIQFQPQARDLAKLPFDLLVYQQEYHTLTGKQLDLREFYEKLKQDGTGNYEQVFVKEYDIENLRKAKQEESIQARINKQVEEKLQIELNKRAMPGTATGQPSVFFDSVSSNIPKEELTAPSGMGLNDRTSVISEAVQDFQKHKQQTA